MVISMNQFARRYGLLQIMGWTLMLAFMLGITLYVHRQDILKEALLDARNYYRLNYHYRAWNAVIGGLYAPIENVQPNPYISIPGRDITTIDHRQLTLVNPAYMSRMVFDLVRADSATPIICRLTSLKPLNPLNTPDAWEREALTAFEQTGIAERFQVISLNGAPYQRLISRFVTERSCLKCHEKQGYKTGDIRGGISIAVPLTPYFIAEAKTRQTITGGYLLLWVSGSAGLALVSRKRHEQTSALKAEVVERQLAQYEVIKLNAELEQRVQERTTQLKETINELESFSYSVSHDLRAPLRSIDGFSHALLENYADKLDQQGQDDLRRVRAASQRMAGLIDDMLRLSRVTRDVMTRETVDLSALARSLEEEMCRAEPDRHVTFIIQEGLFILGDPQLLRLLLQNLLGNAWKFTSLHETARIEF